MMKIFDELYRLMKVTIKETCRQIILQLKARRKGRVYLFHRIKGNHTDYVVDITKEKGYVRGKTTLEVTQYHKSVLSASGPGKGAISFISSEVVAGDEYLFRWYGTLDITKQGERPLKSASAYSSDEWHRHGGIV